MNREQENRPDMAEQKMGQQSPEDPKVKFEKMLAEARGKKGSSETGNKFSSFQKRAADIAMVSETGRNMTLEHDGTFGDQRRIDAEIENVDNSIKKGQYLNEESKVSLVNFLGKLREASQNNKEFLQERIDALSPDERADFMAEKQRLDKQVTEWQGKLDNYKSGDEPPLVQGHPVRNKISDSLNAAIEARNQHEAKLLK